MEEEDLFDLPGEILFDATWSDFSHWWVRFYLKLLGDILWRIKLISNHGDDD